MSQHFPRRVLVAATISLGVLAIGLAMWKASSILLVAFAGLVFGIFLHGVAGWITRRTPLSYHPSLAVVAIALLALTIGLGVFIGPQAAGQVDDLADRAPAAFARVQTWLGGYEWGRMLLDEVPLVSSEAQGSPSAADSTASAAPRTGDGGAPAGGSGETASGSSGGGAMRQAGSLIRGTLSGVASFIGYALLIVFVGLYLAVSPHFYPAALIRLVPPPRRDRAWEVVRAQARALRRWLTGRLASMAVVGILTFIGLWALGIPLPATLAIIAAVFSFVPNLGPILSAVPAILVGLGEGPMQALYVIGLYLAVQTVESYLITPFIQQKAVSIPPALLLTVQVIMGVLFGILGLWLATPLVVTVIVAVQMLYIEDVLGDDVPIMGSGES